MIPGDSSTKLTEGINNTTTVAVGSPSSNSKELKNKKNMNKKKRKKKVSAYATLHSAIRNDPLFYSFLHKVNCSLLPTQSTSSGSSDSSNSPSAIPRVANCRSGQQLTEWESHKHMLNASIATKCHARRQRWLRRTHDHAAAMQTLYGLPLVQALDNLIDERNTGNTGFAHADAITRDAKAVGGLQGSGSASDLSPHPSAPKQRGGSQLDSLVDFLASKF